MHSCLFRHGEADSLVDIQSTSNFVPLNECICIVLATSHIHPHLGHIPFVGVFSAQDCSTVVLFAHQSDGSGCFRSQLYTYSQRAANRFHFKMRFRRSATRYSVETF
ncbi:Hypothetical_protein [Hexamita inflata]|uniref:Hypothetical_protein n=1 Tax=Hexamita inflata TaxID=28002 RepID=A0AA86NNT0_9EUKA|nr:Hypothetical protein HINF_LOCUS9896 [Hexamita inflata]CAI9922254.1 Hypothetical protein HINF_LOCUS9899 [Hexamita inflata]